MTCSRCEPVCPYCGSVRVDAHETILEESSLEEAALRLERVAWRGDLELEEAATELAAAFDLLLEDQAPRVALAAARVADRARWNAHKAPRGLIPGLEAPDGLRGGTGPDELHAATC